MAQPVERGAEFLVNLVPIHPSRDEFMTSPSTWPRRAFIQGAAALSATIVWPGLLSGCGDGGADAQIPASSRLHVLAWGEFGELTKTWGGSSLLTLTRPDGSAIDYGRSRAELNVPTAVAPAPDGSFWVTDTGNRRLVRLSANLQPLGVVQEVAGQRFVRPSGVALLPDGRLAVSDRLLGKLAILSPESGQGQWAGINADQHFATGWRPQWPAETDHRILEDPQVVRVTATGTVVVLDVAARRLVLFTATGDAVDSVPLGGAPTGFAMGPDGACYVCDFVGKVVNRVDLQSRAVQRVANTVPPGQYQGFARDAVWRTATGPDLSHLMVSYR